MHYSCDIVDHMPTSPFHVEVETIATQSVSFDIWYGSILCQIVDEHFARL